MLITVSNYNRLKRILKEYRDKKAYKIKDLKRVNNMLEKVVNTQSKEFEKISNQKKECISKVLELKDENEKLRKQLDEVTRKYDDLRKETFGYNFFSKVAAKKAILEAMGKDKK